MTIDELLERLIALKGRGGEEGHIQADEALLEYIGDDRVAQLHDELAPWYS